MKLVWKLIALACIVLALAAAACAEGVLNLPSNTRTIEEEAFYGLQGVDRVNLPNNVRYIGPRAFGNSSVREIHVPTSRDLRISNDALDGSPNAKIISDDALWSGVFKYAVDGDHIVIKGYLGASPTMNIPAEIDGKPVTHIAKEAFKSRQDITLAVIPNSVTSIGEGAFRDCYTLEQADIPATVTEIGQNAFGYCQALTSAVIPEGITTLPKSLFYGCSSLQSVQLPSTLTAIGDYAFGGGCTKLTTINFPSGLTTIGRQAFDNACRKQPGYPVYTLPETLETLGDGAFYNCDAALCVVRDGSVEAMIKENGNTLTYTDRRDFRYKYMNLDGAYRLVLTGYAGAGGNVAIPAGPVKIGENAFYENTTLTGVTIPEGVTVVDRYAFYGCVNLASATVPNGVTSLADGAFRNCDKLVNVTLPSSLTRIGGDTFRHACYGQTGTHYFNLPDNIDSVGGNAFYECGAVLCLNRGSASATYFRSNQYIYTYAGETDFRFRWYNNEGSGLERLVQYTGNAQSVTIPDHVWLVDADAFKNNTTLKKVVIPEGVTRINRDAFRDCVNLTDITLPSTLTMMEDRVFYNCGSASATDFMLTLSSNISTIHSNVFDSSRMILICDLNSTTAQTVSRSNYSFVRSDLTNKPEFRFRWDYFDHVWGWGLYDYVGTASSVVLPDDCANVNSEKFRNRTDLELVCTQMSATADALSRAELNFTFPGHEGLRYRVIENVLYVMGYAGTGNEIIIPEATAYINAEVDEQIRANAFRDKQTITKVVIPEGVTRINSGAFTNCYLLNDITFPDSLKIMDQDVFVDCGKNTTGIFYLRLPDNMTDIWGRGGGSTTFLNCNAVLVCGKTSQTAALLSDRNYAYTCPGEYDFRYRYEIYPHDSTEGRKLWLVGYVGTGSEVTIPSGIYGIRRFDSNSTSDYAHTFYADGFYGNETVTKVVIPEGTVVIEDRAFQGCVNLTDITFPNSLKVLKNHAFEQCGKNATTRHYFVLPDNMTEISTNTAAGWGSFTDIGEGRLVSSPNCSTALILSGIVDYNPNGSYLFALKGHQTDGLFYQYDRYPTEVQDVYDNRLVLKKYEGTSAEVTIPGGTGLYAIARNVFKDRTDLTHVSIPEGVVEIGDDAFNGCTMLHGGSVINEEWVSDMPEGMPLDVIKLPGTLKTLGNRAFMNVGSDYWVRDNEAKRFYLVLPASLEGFDLNTIAGCEAVLIAPDGSNAAGVLYMGWYYYYSTLEDAVLHRGNYRSKIDLDNPDHIHYGNR